MEATPTSAYLVLEEPSGGRKIQLDSADEWKLGRGEKCAISIGDDTISRTHAMIQRTDVGEYCFIDMGSRNGSFVNDRRVSTPVVLRNGDRISLGKTRILFWNPGGIVRGTTPPPTGTITQVFFARCLVSVLVVDIRDYTGLARAMDQSALCQVLGSWFSEADRIMQKHGSAAQKYIGDAVMALWLHRVKQQEPLEIVRSLRALAEFAEATASLGQRFGLPESLRIGAGLNTGPAAIGNPGTRQVMDFTALGDSVNAAFRLESATKDLGTDVVLGQDTFDYLRSWSTSTKYFRANEVNLKGYDAPVPIWSISFARLREFLNTASDASSTTVEWE